MESTGERVRVTLNWIQILDKLEPFFKERGEFRFLARVSTSDGEVQERRFPETGHYEISDRPGWNKVQLNKVVFEGDVKDGLIVELTGEELDFLSANDQLDPYRRVFEGPAEQWVGKYVPFDEPGDEPGEDPESLSNWRVCYTIEKV